MKQFTINDVLALRPCGWDKEHNSKNYTREKLNGLFAGRQTLTLADVIDMPSVLPVDVVWLACHMFTPRQRVVFALKCAEDAGLSAHEAAAARYARYAARGATWAAREAAMARDAWDTAWAARVTRNAARYAAGAAAWEAAERQLLFIAETILETE